MGAKPAAAPVRPFPSALDLMHAALDCLPCLFRQALNTARVATADDALILQILRRTAQYAAEAPLAQTPAAFSQPIYRLIAEMTGVSDPYHAHKQRTNAEALRLLPDLEMLVKNAADPFTAALHAAVAGNIIDLGIGHSFDIAQDIAALMQQPFAIDDSAHLRSELRQGRRLLYLGDNAGEIVFDTLLVKAIQQYGVEIIYSVKSGPIINDATMADAEMAGMTKLARVIETGGADIGVNWNNVSAEFKQAAAAADVIIGKGHGNFETCIGRPGNFYFLLKAKCPVVARMLGCPEGATVCAHHRN